jgi:hypothetical protein
MKASSPRNLLYLKGCLTADFVEARSSRAELPEDKPCAFEAFIEWLYRSTLTYLEAEAAHPRNKTL